MPEEAIGDNIIMNEKHLDDLVSYLKFPSVSTDSHYKENVRDCAEWQGQTWPRSSGRARNLPRRGTTSSHVL